MPKKPGSSSNTHLELFDAVNIASRTPVFAQFVNLIRFAIASGRLQADERLPTIIELAETLKVNSNTVTKAYHDLEVMGLVHSYRGRGVFVRENVKQRCRRDVAEYSERRRHRVPGDRAT